jgi:hypothetical protein
MEKRRGCGRLRAGAHETTMSGMRLCLSAPRRLARAATGAALCLVSATAISLFACGGSDDAPPEEVDAGVDAPPPPPPPTASRDATGPAEIPIDCPIGNDVEREPNDTPAQASPLTQTSFCGVLDSKDDVDYSTFETPPGKRLRFFQAIVKGKVDFELTSGGKTVGPADTDQFVEGTYVVKAFTKGADPGAYRYMIRFED